MSRVMNHEPSDELCTNEILELGVIPKNKRISVEMWRIGIASSESRVGVAWTVRSVGGRRNMRSVVSESSVCIDFDYFFPTLHTKNSHVIQDDAVSVS